MEKWFIKNVKAPNDIDFGKYGLDPISYRVLVNRGIKSEDELVKYLYPSPAHLHSPILLKDMVKAGNLLLSYLSSKERVRIVGDYDVDGVMSTTILIKGLKALGFEVDYVIPHRIKDGYGINREIVDQAHQEGIKLLLTCDNGVSAMDPIDYARSLGMDVIVTDHHEVQRNEQGEEVLPNANAIINPKQQSCNYPFDKLSGAGVSYKLIVYLHTITGKIEEIDPDLISYAAIATVCDVMDLVGENRTLVALGLERLNKQPPQAIEMMKTMSHIHGDLDTYHLGFIIGPMINSSGRLESAELALKLFLTDDPKEMEKRIQHLQALNIERQKMTEDGFSLLEEQIQAPEERENLIYILRHDDIHESIAGIIAGRLKNKYHRPTVVITKTSKGLKGSGRSIESWNMVEEIGKSKQWLTSFGGHPMACGVSLKEEDYNSFKSEVLSSATIQAEDIIPVERIDSLLPLHQVGFSLLNTLERFRPYGKGNEQALFGATNLKIERIFILGKNKNVLKINLIENNQVFEGILFSNVEEFLHRVETHYGREVTDLLLQGKDNPVNIDILYTPKKNTYRDRTSLQFQVKAYRFK